MTIIYIILLIIAIIILIVKDKDSFLKNLFKVVTLKITDYYCKGTKTKVVMTYMKVVGLLYEGSAIGYPIIKAGVNCNQEKGFWSLFIEYQWDSVSSVMTYLFLGSVTIVVLVYLFFDRNDDNVINTLTEVKKRNDNILSGVVRVHTHVESVDAKLDAVLSNLNSSDLGITEHLLPELRESISKLKVNSAFQYLQTIWKELEISNKGDLKLRSSIQLLMGECARYVKELDSSEFHENAYRLMQNGQFHDGSIIEGMVYEACKRKDLEAAKKYAIELESIDSSSPWCQVPTLMDAEDLKEAFVSLPSSNSNINIISLGICIMMGGGKSHDLGMDLKTYSYNDLSTISTANFPLWIMDLSVATTSFCQNLSLQRNIKLMSNKYAQKVFMLTDRFLSLLSNTEIENILPDTVFLHAVTGYFGNQEKKWLEVLKNSKPTANMEEIFYLTYAFILNNESKYDDAKSLLRQYKGDNAASIFNLRCALAVQNNDFQECIDVVNFSSKNHIIVPDHLANYYFSTVYHFLGSITEEPKNVKFENEITSQAFCLFVDFVSGKEVETDFIISNKDVFPPVVNPYMAIVSKDKISLEFAIELLEKCVDKNVFDIRTALLIDYYSKESVYNQKLYHLLKELRNAGIHDVKNLSIELNMSNYIQDFDNSLEITRILIQLLPDDEEAITSHLLALSKCRGHEDEIMSYKEKVLNKKLSTHNTRHVFSIYHIIGETPFAVEFLYKQIECTNNQELKDFYISMHLNPEIDNVISVEKDTVEIGDYVTIDLNGGKKDILITSGSVYEDLCGCKIEEKKSITIKEDVEVTICEIRTKYYKLLRDIYKEIGETNSSKSIKMFSIDDFDFQNDPLGALQKMTGRTEESRAKEQAMVERYRRGEVSLLSFINDQEFFSDMYKKIFEDFRVCCIPNEFFVHLLEENEIWKNKEIVLDISSVVALHEFDLMFGLPNNIKFNVPKAIMSVLNEQIITEEKGMPCFFSPQLADKINILDKSKTLLWNKLKSIEKWIESRCKVQTVEEIINLNLTKGDSRCFRIEAESLLLTQKGMLLLSEDWSYTKMYLDTIPSMSCFNWLSLMGIDHADDWGYFMLDCGNLGYPMDSNYIRTHYDLASQALPNNYQGCLENMKYYPLAWEEVVIAAKGLLSGIVGPDNISGATNMMVILFKNMEESMCRLIIKKELLGSRDSLWHQCLYDALKISHPLIFPNNKEFM